MSTELAYRDVAKHNTRDDLYLVISGNVYNCSSFVNEHPGGAEVMLDVAGQDATEGFDDVGHSEDAFELLKPLLVGSLKRPPGDPAPKTPTRIDSNPAVLPQRSEQAGFNVGVWILVLFGGIGGFLGYHYLPLFS